MLRSSVGKSESFGMDGKDITGLGVESSTMMVGAGWAPGMYGKIGRLVK